MNSKIIATASEQANKKEEEEEREDELEGKIRK